MFEALTDVGLIDELTDAARAESAAICTRLGCIAQLDARRTVELTETRFWRTDPFEQVTAEVSAALRISRSRAGVVVRQARALEAMPAVMERFRDGDIDYRVVTMILSRTMTVAAAARGAVDAEIGRVCGRWSLLSDKKLGDAIDAVIAGIDPDGVRVRPAADDSRYVVIAPTEPGMAGIWASVHAHDAAGFDQRLDLIAATVCEHDPRTTAQRRADAIGAVGRWQLHLDCQCDREHCPARAAQAATCEAAAKVVFHVLATESTLNGTSDAPGYLPGYGIQPAQTIRDLANSPGVTVTPVTVPADSAEAHYRPSAKLADFVKWRDLTCRFPGCDQPAVVCDIDHTTPYPGGVTHASNTKLFCRTHHLVKTFCPGWTDRQYPDGTIEFTAPTGHVYRTEPHGATLFPTLGTPTGDLPVVDAGELNANRSVMMPKRRRTREQDTAARIAAERRQRHQLNEQLAETQRQHQHCINDNAEPPPF